MAGACLLAGCASRDRQARGRPVDGHLFTLLPASATGVDFANRLRDTRELNVFTYRNFYNGGGVALGDLTGDGLPELMLTANQTGNTLYLNEGGFRFRDVTAAAGVGGKGAGAWATGVTFADVNGDGRLDIYVCYAGPIPGARRANELYLNEGPNAQGVPTFTERAAAWGIADEGFGTQAAFFDYDRDGRLDLYLVNNSSRPIATLGSSNIRAARDSLGGHKLYHNTGSRFEDVSARAGIYGSEIAFGLGIVVSDVNRDGWPDLYVSNDFFEQDYLYINQRDGTFKESLQQELPYSSYFSMGLDIADVNNDGWPDIYVTDMLPEDETRLKTTSQFEDWDVYQERVKNGYHHQFMRNMLHLNNGNGTFSDIGQMAGVARTDWSWTGLIADLDLDGQKDIFVTNGLARDVTAQDYLSFLASDQTMRSAVSGRHVDFLGLVHAMSSTPLPDYAFRNTGDLSFTNASAAWGVNTPNFSNGAAYGDLDGDGALDLVVNNVNQDAFIYRNNARTLTKNHYLQIALLGDGPNRYGVGAAVTLRHGEQLFFQELDPSRGFQSSVDYVLSFGLGSADTVDSVTVEWPDGRVSQLHDVASNQRITIKQTDARIAGPPDRRTARPPIFTNVTDQTRLPFVHHENAFVDFNRERLIPKLLSTEGPYLAVADVNGDGLEDAFLGGAKDQPGALLLQQSDGRFLPSNEALLAGDKISEDLGAVFFDANGDGRPDLYVVSGGSEFSAMAPALTDRLYINEGRGRFRKATGSLPVEYESGSRVVAADYDGDGDIDLFVCGRLVPWRYGSSPASTLLANDGHGRFTDVTAQAAPDLARIGMVTDALWNDLDGDGRPELVVVGEWMPITIFRNTGGGKLALAPVPGLERSHGWWNRIVAADFTGDGRVDFLVGNLGLNARLQASPTEPVTMYVKDFDGNGFAEQIVSCYNAGKSYPMALRDDLIKALPYLQARYPNYKAYATQQVTDIFSSTELAGAELRQAYTFATTLVKNNGDGSFTLLPLPREAQIAPVYGILASDFDGDGALDVLLAGNFDGVKPEIGRLSAGYGLYLRGDGKGGFTAVRTVESGFFVPGQARDIQRLRTRRGTRYVVTRNNDRPLVFRVGP